LGISRAEANDLTDHFKADIASGAMDIFAIAVFDYRRVEDLIAKHGFQHRLGSLDALQLGVALDLRDQGLGETIVATEAALCEVAARKGLSVLSLRD